MQICAFSERLRRSDMRFLTQWKNTPPPPVSECREIRERSVFPKGEGVFAWDRTDMVSLFYLEVNMTTCGTMTKHFYVEPDKSTF